MKRYWVGILVAVLAAGLSTSASAEPKKKGHKKHHAEAAAPNSAQLAESLGDLRWGMSKDELMQKLIDKVKEKYKPLIGKTQDAIKEDHLRQKARQELDAIRKGYVEFDGRSTGWDVSFLKGEFTHNNDESMLAVRDQNSQNFYFFIGGKLWKWYKAFDAAVFPADNFNAFAGAVQHRFGKAKEVTAELQPGEPARHWLEWQDKQTRLKAVDQTDFYGFYCLVFEEKSTSDNIARLRPHVDKSSNEKKYSLVEAVTSGTDSSPDDSPNIVDRLTGHTRQVEHAPQQAEQASAKPHKGSSKSSSSSDEDETPVSSEDDPISGLGL